MIGILQRGINIRSSMPEGDYRDVGDLLTGDIVIGTILNGWIAFDHVYRKGTGYGRENLSTTRYAAVADPANPATKFMWLIDEVLPQSNPTPKPLDISIGGEDYVTVAVQLKPK